MKQKFIKIIFVNLHQHLGKTAVWIPPKDVYLLFGFDDYSPSINAEMKFST